MKELIFAAVAVLAVLVAPAPTAAADAFDQDPYHPDLVNQWCPGGGAPWASVPVCNGIAYDDGTQWQISAHRMGFGGYKMSILCIVAPGGLFYQVAGDGGCGDEW